LVVSLRGLRVLSCKFAYWLRLRPMADESYYAGLCKRMVSEQIVARGIRDPLVLDALRAVPRHRFVPPEYADMAYSDGPLPIGQGQTISQPYIVALMTEVLELRGDENVLEVGTGSGYQAAVLAHLAKQVHTIERHAALAERAENILLGLGISNVQVHVGDGSLGLPKYAPYQAIIVTAAAPAVPQPLLDQLDEGGRLVLPVGGTGSQILESWRRQGENFEREAILAVAFVPLRGEHGWKQDHWGFS
jgi:protein-L-isoaspartate(D-aspartate) O-methyltransferase